VYTGVEAIHRQLETRIQAQAAGGKASGAVDYPIPALFNRVGLLGPSLRTPRPREEALAVTEPNHGRRIMAPPGPGSVDPRKVRADGR
jgi:hypothetical protein